MFVFALELIVSVKEQFSTFWSTTQASISSQKKQKKSKQIVAFCVICKIAGEF